MHVAFDKILYSKRELGRLRELTNPARPPVDILSDIEKELSSHSSGPFRYMLLLLAANTCAQLFRYDDAQAFLQQADALFPPGEIQQIYYFQVCVRIAVDRNSYREAFSILYGQLARENQSVEDRGFFLLYLCAALRGTGDIKEALRVALELRDLWRNSVPHDVSQLARAEHNVSNLYGEMGRWEESLSHIEAALELYRQAGDINGQARVHNGIAAYFYLSSAYEVALESYSASERLYVSVGNEQRALSVRGNIALCYHDLGRNDEAIRRMKAVADGYYALSDYRNHARAMINLARMMMDADIVAAEAIVLQPEIVPHLDIIMKGVQSLVLAGAACVRGEYDRTVTLARTTLAMCEQTGYDQYMRRALDLIAHALSSQGDSKGAYEYQLQAYEHTRAQHRRQLEAQRHALTLKLQRERIEHERAMLRDEVEQKQKELTATTLKLVERSKLMGLVTQRLRDLRAGVSHKNKPLVSDTLALIESQSGNVWEAFEQSLNYLTNRFFQMLAERHDNLSPTEQRIAGLLRAGMSTKEVAAAMHVSTRTVETHRYRLRKKLLHDGATDLIAYLQHLGSAGEE